VGSVSEGNALRAEEKGLAGNKLESGLVFQPFLIGPAKLKHKDTKPRSPLRCGVSFFHGMPQSNKFRGCRLIFIL
jgi:hypothetical protein